MLIKFRDIKVILKQRPLISSLSPKNIILLALAAISFVMFSAEAVAKVKAVNFVAGVIRKHDTNIFRTANNTESDNITSYQLGLKLDKKISLQRVTAKAIISHNRYNSNDRLNFTSKEFEAAWHWALTPRLTGKLSANRSEFLNDFNDTRETRKNIRVAQNQQFLADFNPYGGWHYLAGISRRTSKNSQAFNEDASFSANAVDFGVRYDFPSGSTVTLMNHARKGKFDDRQVDPARLFDDKYKEYESGVELDWPLTVKSRIIAGGSYLKRKHDNFSRRDYSGFQGFLGYDWSPTERINVSLNAKSELNSFQTNTDSYTRRNELNLKPTYKLTPKTKLRGIFTVAERKFLGSGNVSQTRGSRDDNYKAIGIGAEWNPTQQSAIELSVLRYDLNSNDNTFDYDGNAVYLSGRIEF